MSPDFVRNAIAAAAIVLSLGGSFLNWLFTSKNDLSTLQLQLTEQARDITDLKDVTHAILCKIDPGSIDCGRNGRF